MAGEQWTNKIPPEILAEHETAQAAQAAAERDWLTITTQSFYSANPGAAAYVYRDARGKHITAVLAKESYAFRYGGVWELTIIARYSGASWYNYVENTNDH